MLVWTWCGPQWLLACLVWGQTCSEGCKGRGGHTGLCPWDPSPLWSHLTAPGPRLTGGSGIGAVAAGSWTALVAQYLKGISACREAALTPLGAGASSPARETPWEQLKGFVFKGFGLVSYLPVASVRPRALCQGLPGVGSMGGITRSVPMQQWGPGPASQIRSEILHKCLELQSGLNLS